jgi:cell division protein FtsL
MIALFAIALLQLVLAGEATDAISSIANLEKEIEVLQAEVDALTAQMESLGSPRRIEEQAVRLGLKPFTVFELAR